MPSAVKHKFVVDSRGRKTGVILSLRDHRKLIREMEDLRDAQFVDEAESSVDGFISVSELRQRFAQKAK